MPGCAQCYAADSYPTACYQPQELGITAVLLGSLIHNQLLEGTSLRIALRFVEEAYHAPPDNKLMRFAQLALGEFRSDVGIWPDFCAQMLKVIRPHCRHCAQPPHVIVTQ